MGTPVNIHVVVHKARNIEKKGMFGKADPYVTVKIGSESYKSVTIKNNHNPEWQFDSNFILDKNSTEDIIIEVFDEDIGKDDTLGEKCLNIKDILEKQNLFNQWVPLENCKSGDVLLSITSTVHEFKKMEELTVTSTREDTTDIPIIKETTKEVISADDK